MAEERRNAECEARGDCPNPCSDLVTGLPDAVTVLDFETIARGAKVVCVMYRGQCYRLRSTRNGKLILNK